MRYMMAKKATKEEKAFLKKVIKEDKQLEYHRRKLARINRKYSTYVRRRKHKKHRRR